MECYTKAEKREYDYSKCVIYKIVCRDANVKDIYIGHSTNIDYRRDKHEFSCSDINSKNYNKAMYIFMRENGGWDNWKISIIEVYPCNNLTEARIREQYWMDKLKPSLNKNRAYNPNSKINNRENIVKKKKKQKKFSIEEYKKKQDKLEKKLTIINKLIELLERKERTEESYIHLKNLSILKEKDEKEKKILDDYLNEYIISTE